MKKGKKESRIKLTSKNRLQNQLKKYTVNLTGKKLHTCLILWFCDQIAKIYGFQLTVVEAPCACNIHIGIGYCLLRSVIEKIMYSS